MTRAIVTGVAGFVGAHVAQWLLTDGWEVLGIDDLSGGFRENVPEGVDFRQHDCGLPVESLMTDFQPQVVFHLAAYAAEGLSHHIPVFNYRNNVLATANVFAAAQRVGVEHFVFTSSIAAYGHPNGSTVFREDDRCQPCDPYGVAKLACEQHIAAAASYFDGPRYTIFRPHNVYGPKQNVSDPYRNVVGIFVRRGLEGLPMPIFGSGEQSRCFSYIDPVAKAIARSVRVPEASNQVFNIGGDEPTSVLELAQTVAQVLDIPLKIQHLPPRSEVLHAHADHQRARAVFPELQSEQIPLNEGIAHMVAAVRDGVIPPRTPCPSPIELEDRLPASWRGETPSSGDAGPMGD